MSPKFSFFVKIIRLINSATKFALKTLPKILQLLDNFFLQSAQLQTKNIWDKL